MEIEIQQVEPQDEELIEEWVRNIDDYVLGVDVTKDIDGYCQVCLRVAEFIVDDPLESEMCSAMETALRTVAGVTEVHQEDREVWQVSGDPSCLDLITAASSVVDALESRAREYIDSFNL